MSRQYAVAVSSLLVVAMVFLLAGKALGVISFVGYEAQHIRQWGFASAGESGPDFGFPAILSAGDALEASYRVTAKYGALRLHVRGSNRPGHGHLSPAHVRIGGNQQGKVLFLAQTGGWYSYKSDADVLAGNSCPQESLAATIIPDRECPTLDVDYEVTWRHIKAGELVTADTPIAIVPGEGEQLVAIEIR